MSVSRIGNNIFQALNYRSIGNPNALAHSVSKWVRANMRAGISEKSIWATHHADKKLFGFSIHHDLILTCSKGGSISCLDFRTGQKKWTHSDPSVNWDREIFIMSDKDRVIYLGFLKNEPATIFKKFIIQILSLNSGEKIKDIVIKHYHQVTITIAEEIFARVGDKIGQWDLNGKFIRAISLPGLSTFDICPL
ncbi:MAG TPA: hypothetical protein VLF61_04050, partial [Rhabdochlamydiaceae bacterium]|nr:hypothetical protein [Rhabdochlamydiaceae bacterium]